MSHRHRTPISLTGLDVLNSCYVSELLILFCQFNDTIQKLAVGMSFGRIGL